MEDEDDAGAMEVHGEEADLDDADTGSVQVATIVPRGKPKPWQSS
jgi:hypothetical protein